MLAYRFPFDRIRLTIEPEQMRANVIRGVNEPSAMTAPRFGICVMHCFHSHFPLRSWMVLIV